MAKAITTNIIYMWSYLLLATTVETQYGRDARVSRLYRQPPIKVRFSPFKPNSEFNNIQITSQIQKIDTGKSYRTSKLKTSDNSKNLNKFIIVLISNI